MAMKSTLLIASRQKGQVGGVEWPDLSSRSIHLTMHVLQLVCRQLDRETTLDAAEYVYSSQHSGQTKPEAHRDDMVSEARAFDKRTNVLTGPQLLV